MPEEDQNVIKEITVKMIHDSHYIIVKDGITIDITREDYRSQVAEISPAFHIISQAFDVVKSRQEKLKRQADE